MKRFLIVTASKLSNGFDLYMGHNAYNTLEELYGYLERKGYTARDEGNFYKVFDTNSRNDHSYIVAEGYRRFLWENENDN